MRRTWTWKIPAAAAGARADRALTDAIAAGDGAWLPSPPPSDWGRITRSRVQTLIERGLATVDGRPVQPGGKLKPGATVAVAFPEPEPIGILHEDIKVEILHEDEHLLVVNKPPGLTVHPSETQKSGTLVNALASKLAGGGPAGALRPGIVHRIDKDTSGVLVVTRSELAHQALTSAFSRHDIERLYWALCYGSPGTSEEIRVETLIGRSRTDRKRMSTEVRTGRNAVTLFRRREEYAVEGARPFASWLQVAIETGRTHQIRVHLTSKGYSVLGDPVYGTPTSGHAKWKALPEPVREAVTAMPGQALHARLLGFVHPATGKMMRFEAEPPEGFRKLLDALKGYR